MDADERPESQGVPQDVEAEEQVIGSLLLDDYAIGQVAGVLRPVDFFSAPTRTVFAAMLALHERQQPTDISLVRAELEQRKQLDDLGGVSLLARYLNTAPTSVNLLHYAGIVTDKAARRRLLKASALIANAAYEADTAAQAVDQAATVLAEYSAGPAVGHQADLGALAALVWDEVSGAVQRRQEGEVVAPGLATGVVDLDHNVNLRPGDLLLLAARPSMGKTSLAVQIAADVARQGKQVLVFSLEMPGRDVAGRHLWQTARLDAQALLRGEVDDAGVMLERLGAAVGEAETLPLRIDDTPGLAVAALAARARAHQHERGLALVVVDYLQLLKGTPRRDGNRVAEVTEISQALKTMARDLNVPVLALSQLNRSIEHRTGGRPQLSDLRDSGALEQDADVVLFLSKDDPQGPPIIRVTIAKNRNGATGSFSLRFDGASTRFDPFSGREEDSYPGS